MVTSCTNARNCITLQSESEGQNKGAGSCQCHLASKAKLTEQNSGNAPATAPAGRRSVRNNGKKPLVMLCVQYRQGTFTADDLDDATILPDKVEW